MKRPGFDNAVKTLLEMAGEMALLEGPYFTNLAKLRFKVISKCLLESDCVTVASMTCILTERNQYVNLSTNIFYTVLN